MNVPLTNREIEFILAWKENAFWPDEERVINKLKRSLASAQTPCLSRLQLQIVYNWAEEQLGGHYGGGAVGNAEERSIMDKLKTALEAGASTRSG